LHKNPARCQSFELPVGRAHVFYPEASGDRCTVAMLLEVDPVGLVRGRGKTLREYVNDRPYAASSFLSVAISRVFGTAMRGKSKDRPTLAQTPLPLSVGISVLPCEEGEGFIERLFGPLGYAVQARRHPLDEAFPKWGRAGTSRSSSRLMPFLGFGLSADRSRLARRTKGAPGRYRAPRGVLFGSGA
jgi:3' terminal RNA ribose 2'-O-methyltransferase Hen1